jgi:hypothetical protein
MIFVLSHMERQEQISLAEAAHDSFSPERSAFMVAGDAAADSGRNGPRGKGERGGSHKIRTPAGPNEQNDPLIIPGQSF